MVFKNNDNEFFIGGNPNYGLFSLTDGKKVSINENLIKLKNNDEEFKSFLDYNERIIRLFNFITSFNRSIPNLFCRIYSIVGEDKIKILKRESYSNSIDNLNLNNLKGEVYLEIFILSDDVNIQDILEQMRLIKCRYSIYHLFDLEDNDVFLSSKNIKRIYVPDYINKIIKKVK